MFFMIGWATGGVIFGILGDRIGRAKTMALTILVYSLLTGFTALAWDVYSFSLCLFLTGLGVGGQFAVGVALVAEVMPDHARPHALGWLQALSTVGNVSATLISLGMIQLKSAGYIPSYWRFMFVIGVLPALLVVAVMLRLREPERWQAAVSARKGKQKLGSLRELFGNPTWRVTPSWPCYWPLPE